MAGFTIIHLSDLHIGNEDNGKGKNHQKYNKKPQRKNRGKEHYADESYSLEFEDLAEFNAESLAFDFKKVADEYSFNPLPEETFVVITGDITSTPKWENFENAVTFIQKLQNQLSQCMETGEFPFDHIICIPGNHDIEIPETIDESLSSQYQEKYRNFKLFSEKITNYSHFSRNFTLDRPYVNVHIPVPFHLQILDLNSTLNIRYITEPVSLTLHDQNNLNNFLKNEKDVFRIALMHHQIDDLPSEDGGGKLSQSTLRKWLTDNGFGIVLCGHAHLATDKEVKPVFKENGLLELGTGRSFLMGRPRDEGNHYQIIRIEPSKNTPIQVIRRKYAYNRNKTKFINQGVGHWELDGKTATPNVSHLKKLLTTDFKKFIGIQSFKDWIVVAHCDSLKFEDFGVLSPGEQVNANLLNIIGSNKGSLKHLNQQDPFDWKGISSKEAIFLVDSPHFNPYVNYILKNYTTYLAGGSIIFHDNRKIPVKQHIEIENRILQANKTDKMDIFDNFEDYLLIMRLPNFIHDVEETIVELHEKHRVIWVIAGIHSKASYAGAMIFTPKNLQLFSSYLRNQCGGNIPEYFEAIFATKMEPERIDDFSKLTPVHFRMLRQKSEIAIADDLPSEIALRFLNKDQWNAIPINTVHFDPVAACNFNCKNCIETKMKKKNIYLSMNACTSILCDLKDMGCQNLNFYGGEPTLHPQFDTLLNLSKHLGFDILIVTNGSKLGEERIANAIIRGRDRIHLRVSIDAGSPESHQLNHGLTKDCYHNILSSTGKLITQGVPISISYLLHKKSIDESVAACQIWKEKNASAFILRPITNIYGKSPMLDYTLDDKSVLKNVIKDNKGFVYAPKWFENWLNENNNNTNEKYKNQEKEYKTCFSGYYRLAISPFITKKPNNEFIAVDDAWISLCTYRRYDEGFGCEYPKNLKTWTQMERGDLIEKIDPSSKCKKIICCRDDYNNQIKDLIASMNLNPGPIPSCTSKCVNP